MKTALAILLTALLAAGAAFAQEGNEPVPAPDTAQAGAPAGGPPPWAKMQRGGPPMSGPMSPEMMKEMRAANQEIKALGDAARAVTNEAAKAEIVAQLRAKLGEVADRMQKHQEERLAQAQERLSGLQERIEYSKTNRDKLIEEQIQRILSGERPPQSEAFDRFPHAKGAQPGGEGEGGEGNRRGQRRWDKHGGHWDVQPPPPPEMGDEMAPPPPEEGLPGEVPPPPEEEILEDMDAPPPGE